MRVKWIFFLVSLLMAGLVSAQSPKPAKKATTAKKSMPAPEMVKAPAKEEPPVNKIEFTEYTLDNGLHVILHQDNTTPIVAVSVMYHVGSKNENPERTGFAHFFEHLLFEGSANIGRGEFDKYVQNAGGTLNANTSFDRTYYFEILPSNQLELGLWLESERMLHAKVEEKGIETQREVVKEEKRQRYDNQPYGTILIETLRRAYRQHPYRWDVIGSMEHLNAATEADYKQFYADFYVPNNAILSIAGDINIEQAKPLIAKYFGTIPKGTKEIYRPNIVEPPLGGEVRDTVYDNIQLPAVIQAYRIPAQGTDDFYAVSMLGTLLSQGESSRLYRALVDEQQKALFVGNFPLPTEDPGLSIAFGITNIGVSAKDLEAALDAEIEKVQKELIPEQEFQKLRNQVENDFITANSSVAGIAESLANYKMYYGDSNLINTEIERYMKVTREDIQRVAKQYFNKNNRVVLHYMPKSPQP
ncbi:MAG TPA: pitrilysin family protein [Saprospiraceae bacterium]|nr:pitrilysin family protein [Saprospiraceae bacterium]HMP24991.1 pitrilysin family protein [Saprospiraceae bacterium]